MPWQIGLGKGGEGNTKTGGNDEVEDARLIIGDCPSHATYTPWSHTHKLRSPRYIRGELDLFSLLGRMQHCVVGIPFGGRLSNRDLPPCSFPTQYYSIHKSTSPPFHHSTIPPAPLERSTLVYLHSAGRLACCGLHTPFHALCTKMPTPLIYDISKQWSEYSRTRTSLMTMCRGTCRGTCRR